MKRTRTALAALTALVCTLSSCTKPTPQSWIDADQQLAAAILSDSTLLKVDLMGRQLLSKGYNAGAGYHEVWIRDFNTFIETLMDVVPPTEVRSALTVFFLLQQPNGEIVDGYVPRTSRSADPEPYYSDADTLHVGFKNTVETDQETSLIQAVRKYIEKSGDRSFLCLDVAGATVYERMTRAVDYLMTEKYDAGTGLLTGALTADWGDVENDTVCCIDIGEGSTVTVDIYDNAMMVIALRDLVRMAPDASAAAEWQTMEDNFRTHIRRHLWDDRQKRFRPHLYPNGLPADVYFDESQIYYHGGTAIAIEADLLTADEVRTVNASMLENVRLSGMPSIGLTVYPPYPQDFFPYNCGMKNPFNYQNGGDWTWFGGRMIQQLVRYGMVAEAYQEVRPMIDRVLVNGDFYEWYGKGNIPMGSSAYKGSAGALCKAIRMLREWAASPPSPSP
ncbi:MAG: hypothetical protein K5945_03245 [Bacteroidaceae bacterium]|nr:hypothetical protein [Bacteroidaceae bacterium]